ncbi:MAG: YkgJ family cysteine cluster protein [Bacteroidales bacterium]
MNLTTRIRAVNRIFALADAHTAKFRAASGLRCLDNCGLCCTNPNIRATVLEFLPLAQHLVVSDTHISVYERLISQNDTVCVNYNPFESAGHCTAYQNRGLICRMFGFTARTNQHGKPELVTCNLIKKSIPQEKIDKTLIKAPVMADYYMKLYGIDPNLSVQYLPVNESVKKALEIVLLESQFRKKRA